MLVHGEQEFRAALTRVPLDRLAEGTTGGMARAAGADSLLFDQEGTEHRQTRHSAAEGLGAAGVTQLRPLWMERLDEAAATLAAGDRLDAVELAEAISGATAAALLDLPIDPLTLARAARAAASEAAQQHLPGWHRPHHRRRPPTPCCD